MKKNFKTLFFIMTFIGYFLSIESVYAFDDKIYIQNYDSTNGIYGVYDNDIGNSRGVLRKIATRKTMKTTVVHKNTGSNSLALGTLSSSTSCHINDVAGNSTFKVISCSGCSKCAGGYASQGSFQPVSGFAYKYTCGNNSCDKTNTHTSVYCLDPGMKSPNGYYLKNETLTNKYNSDISKYAGIAYLIDESVNGGRGWQGKNVSLTTNDLYNNTNTVRTRYYKTQVALWKYLDDVNGTNYLTSLNGTYLSYMYGDSSSGNELRNFVQAAKNYASNITKPNNSLGVSIQSVDNNGDLKPKSEKIYSENLKYSDDGKYLVSDAISIYGTNITTNNISVSGNVDFQVKNSTGSTILGNCSGSKSCNYATTANNTSFKVYIPILDDDGNALLTSDELSNIEIRISGKIESSQETVGNLPYLVAYSPQDTSKGMQNVIFVDWTKSNIVTSSTLDYEISLTYSQTCNYNATFDDLGCCEAIWIKTFKDEIGAGMTESEFNDKFYSDHPECATCDADDYGYNINGNANCSENGSSTTYDDVIELNDKCIYSNDYQSGDSPYYEETVLYENGGTKYCTIRCVEDFKINFPPSPGNLVTTAGYFVWPNTPLTYSYFGKKDLTTIGTKECRIMVNRNALLGNPDSTNILNKCKNNLKTVVSTVYDTDPEFKLSYEYDNDFKSKINSDRTGSKAITLDSYNREKTCSSTGGDDCNNLGTSIDLTSTDLDKKINSIRKYRFSIKISSNYKIPDNVNSYVDHNGVAHDVPSNDYSIIGFGNIPLGYMSKNYDYFNKKRSVSGTVKISYDKLGSDNEHFDVSNDYSCPFEAQKYVGEVYVCGVDTLMPNYSITDCVVEKLKNGQDIVGAKADCQPICNANACPEGTNMAGKDISTDVDSKVQYIKDNSLCDDSATCTEDRIRQMAYYMVIEEDKVCDGTITTSETYVCPTCEKEPGRGDCVIGAAGSMADITWCVVPLLNKGYSLSSARAYCEMLNCPYSSGKVVIYRPIVFENSFPSITDFGRLPGVNWRTSRDDTTKYEDFRTYKLVDKYINNNRNVYRNQVYNANPLYTFDLAPDSIRDIRSYNKGKTYDDFTLSCQKYGQACISELVHDYASAGTCKDLTSGGVTGQYNLYYDCLAGGI